MTGVQRSRRPGNPAAAVCLTGLAFVSAVLLSIQWAPVFQELMRDSGTFLYEASELLGGKRPYVDFWDHKPPAIFLIDALGLAMGMGRWGVWGVETFLFAVSVSVLFAALLRRLGTLPAVAGGAFVIYAMRNGAIFEGGNFAESYASCLGMLLVAGLVVESPRWIAWFLMGVAGAVMFFTKQSCIGAPAAVALVLGWLGLVRRRPPFGRFLAAYLLGAAATAALAVGAMAWFGILGEFWSSNIVFNGIYVAERGVPSFLRYVKETYWALTREGLFHVSMLALIGVVLELLLPARGGGSPARRRLAAAVGLAGALELWTICLPGTFYGHYFLTLAPLVGVGLAFWMDAGWRWASRLLAERDTRAKAAAVKGILFCLGAASLTGPLAILQRGGNAGKAVFPQRFSEDPELLAYLKGELPDGPLLVWGAESKWNFLAHRPAPTRYNYNYPLCYRRYDQPRRFAEFLADLKDHPGTVILDTEFRTHNSLDPNARNPIPGATAPIPSELIGQLRAYVAENYRRDRSFPNSSGWVAYVPRQRLASSAARVRANLPGPAASKDVEGRTPP